MAISASLVMSERVFKIQICPVWWLWNCSY